MVHFTKMHALVFAGLWLVAPAGRASATVLLDDFDGASKSNAADIVRNAADLADAPGDALASESPFGGEFDNAETALAEPPIEIAGRRWTEVSDTTEEPLVEVDSLDYKVFGVSLTNVFLTKR